MVVSTFTIITTTLTVPHQKIIITTTFTMRSAVSRGRTSVAWSESSLPKRFIRSFVSLQCSQSSTWYGYTT